ncbi:MAG: crotonase/enoyl-CoA hydratase family protein [Salinisphaeraceae bacterium]|nr:crotonase/enoyl-CoA hydratase family protein [Salinisphaeraceae bacterium]
MSEKLVSYELNDGVATITIDDGKRNALPPAMFKEIYAAFAQAEADEAIVVLTGRQDVFSAGFDLKVMKAGGTNTIKMLKLGYSLTARVLEYPYPVVMACNGHCFAMGVFLMLSGDYIIGTQGDYQVSANEVAIGIPLPRVAEIMLRHRLNPAEFQRAGILAEHFSVDGAHAAGFFDEVVTADKLAARAQEKARELAQLDMSCHKQTKLRVRKDVISQIRRSVPLDLKDAVVFGVRSAMKARKK